MMLSLPIGYPENLEPDEPPSYESDIGIEGSKIENAPKVIDAAKTLPSPAHTYTRAHTHTTKNQPKRCSGSVGAFCSILCFLFSSYYYA